MMKWRMKMLTQQIEALQKAVASIPPKPQPRVPHNKVREDRIAQRKTEVYNALKNSEGGFANAEQLAAIVGLSRRATLELLNLLRKEGLVSLYGSSRSVRWGVK